MQNVATYEAQFIKKLSSFEAELKKSIAYKKKRAYIVLQKQRGIQTISEKIPLMK